jgi:hypothetical protein
MKILYLWGGILGVEEGRIESDVFASDFWAHVGELKFVEKVFQYSSIPVRLFLGKVEIGNWNVGEIRRNPGVGKEES